MAKCCTPVPGDEICGYISLGRGITIHRDDCPNVRALKRTPERFTPVHWDDSDAATSSFRVTIALQSWDRPRLLEDVARTFAEHGANIVEYGGHVADQMARNWYTVEVGDVKELRSLLRPCATSTRSSTPTASRPADRLPRVSGTRARSTVWQGHPSWKAMLLFYVKWTLLSLIPVAVWVVLDSVGADVATTWFAVATASAARAHVRRRVDPAPARRAIW